MVKEGDLITCKEDVGSMGLMFFLKNHNYKINMVIGTDDIYARVSDEQDNKFHILSYKYFIEHFITRRDKIRRILQNETPNTPVSPI